MSQTSAGPLSIQEISVDGYEKVLLISDEPSKLQAIICIHNTALGPALGGTRIHEYPSHEAALTDAKRLAKGMTYKAALLEAGLGGGKSVILCDPKRKTKEMLIAFAKAVDTLGGEYTCAEDAGCSLEDATFISEYTPYVVGTAKERSSGNPSAFTAWGTFRGIKTALHAIDGNSSVEGKTVAIQGLGSVGSLLAEILFWHGARLVVTDIDCEKTDRIAKQWGASPCHPDDILSTPCDVFAPCAMGGILNAQTIPMLRCRAVAGSANNQLWEDADADLLKQRNILYTPDFVINAGGFINVSFEVSKEGYHSRKARDKVDGIYTQLLSLFDLAKEKGCSTHQAAMDIGNERIQQGIGKRIEPPHWPR